MKKLLAALIVAAMAAALAACGGGSQQPTGSVVEETAAPAETVEETIAPAETVEETTAPAETVEETTAPAADETTEAADQGGESYEMGSTVGLVYENEYLGIGCKIPEGWDVYDEEQIAEVNGFVMDNVDEEAREMLETAGYVYDLVTSDPQTQNNINIIVQKMNLLASASLNGTDMEEVLSSTEDSLRSSLENLGAENLTFKIDRGYVFPIEGARCAVVTGDIQGLTFEERLVMFKTGNYITNITAASFDGTPSEDLMNIFYTLD